MMVHKETTQKNEDGNLSKHSSKSQRKRLNEVPFYRWGDLLLRQGVYVPSQAIVKRGVSHAYANQSCDLVFSVSCRTLKRHFGLLYHCEDDKEVIPAWIFSNLESDIEPGAKESESQS